MNGDELIRRLRKLAKARGLELRFDPLKGKGSHGALFLGDRRTTMKDRKKEIGPGLLAAILAQLGLTRRDIE